MQTRLRNSEEEKDKEALQLQAEIERLKDEIRVYKTRLEVAEAEIQRLRSLLDSLKEQMTEKDLQLDELSNEDMYRSSRFFKVMEEQQADQERTR